MIEPRKRIAAAVTITVRPPPLFAIRHAEAALQVARGRERAARASKLMWERDARDRERALRYIRLPGKEARGV